VGIEIEYKFLVKNDNWRENAGEGLFYRQGFIASDATGMVRVSLTDDKSWLTIKRAKTPIHRLEYEYPLPRHDAEEMLRDACLPGNIVKQRYRLPHAGHVWEIDVFAAENAGLVVAEIELSSAGEAFERPDWLGKDISTDPRYFAMNLARHPYRAW
jgi:adenylate cyclase